MVDLVLSQVTLLPEAVAADGADEGLLQPAVLDLLVVHQPCSQHNIIYTPDLCHSALSFDSFSIPFVDVNANLNFTFASMLDANSLFSTYNANAKVVFLRCLLGCNVLRYVLRRNCQRCLLRIATHNAKVSLLIIIFWDLFCREGAVFQIG